MKNQMSIAATILAVAGIGARGPKFVIPAKQAVSKRHPSEAQTPEIVIPAKAGIQAAWSGETPL